jgi:hypothetical protein
MSKPLPLLSPGNKQQNNFMVKDFFEQLVIIQLVKIFLPFVDVMVHHHPHGSLSLYPFLDQFNPIRSFTSCFFKIQISIIPHLHVGLPSGFFP